MLKKMENIGRISEYKFDSRGALLQQLSQDVMGGLSRALAARSQAAMLLSGGTSPGALYRMMAQEPLDWARVWFGLSDERWVAPDDPDSNEKLVRDTLLRNRAAAAHFIGLKATAQDVAQGARESNRFLKALPRPFDLVLLGMGNDGHTASLFPDSPDIAAALDDAATALCHPIRRRQNKGRGEGDRITMTLNSLLHSREIKLLIFGTEKWRVYRQARRHKSSRQPVSHILHQARTPVSVYWAK